MATPPTGSGPPPDSAGLCHGCYVKNHEELAIHDLVARYCEALLRADPDAWGATWAKDATWDLAGFVVEGVDAIVDLWLKAIASFAFIVQTESNPILHIDDDGLTAHGRWTVEEFLGSA